MLIAGINSFNSMPSSNTYYYNHKTTNWTNGPILNFARSYFGAGIVFDDITQEKLVVVTGGIYTNSTNDSLNSTEILMDDKWYLGEMKYNKYN